MHCVYDHPLTELLIFLRLSVGSNERRYRYRMLLNYVSQILVDTISLCLTM